ncbi:MAG: M1 family metallopeptidase [Candidatus Aminicenantales bacterium]
MQNLDAFRFWYNSGVRKKGLTAVLLFLLSGVLFGQGSLPLSTEPFPFLAGLKQAFDASDRTAYLSYFAEGIRSAEENDYEAAKQSFYLNEVDFSLASRNAKMQSDEPLYVQAVFQNDEEVLFETWKLELARDGDRWVIRTKTETGNPTFFYKLRIPSERVERAARVTIRHADLTATFENVWVYYDNLSRVETGLIILGPGRMQFAPSSDTERHQLDLRFHAGFLDTPLVSAYLRFSPSFFARNIKIVPAGSGSSSAMPTPAEEAKVEALFERFYGDSFSIDNSLIGQRLSVLPQGEQAVFEFGTGGRGGFTYMYSPFSEEEVHFRSRVPDQLLCYYSPITGDGGGRRMMVSIGGTVDVLRTDIDLEFQPDRFYFSSHARIEMEALGSGAESQRFDFNPALDVANIFDQEGRELFYTQDKVRGLLYVRFLQALEKGQKVAVDVYYRGALAPPPPTSELSIAGRWSGPLSGDDGFLYGRAAAWYPASFDEDYFLSRLQITLPPDFGCVASGALVSEETTDKAGRRAFVFETWKAIKSLAFFVGRIQASAKDDNAFPPITFFISDNLRNSRRDLIKDAREIVRFYAKIFGPFPYEKLSVVERLGPTIGGSSPASFIVLNESPKESDVLNAKEIRSPVDLPQYKEFIMAHEIGHQWWGQAVTGATYHDQWLSEGLSQYAAIRYLASKYGEEAIPALLRKSVSWTQKMSFYGPITLGARLSFLNFQAFQSILYGKTCVVLFLLSDLIGEEAMDRGLRAFQESRAYRSARTIDFVRSMERASGRPLEDFFSGWFDSYVLPDVSVSHRYLKEGDESVLTIVVHQSGAVLTFPLEVTWLEDTRLVRKTLTVTAATETFSFPVGAKPAKFKVDPDGRIPGTFR